MTPAVQIPPLTFEQFLDYDDGTETLYELIDGCPLAMPEPSRQHQSIVRYLDRVFSDEIERLGKPWETVRNTAIRVPGRFLADGRRPDLAIVDLPQSEAEQQEKGIKTTPHMVIEVASSNWKDDLRDKIFAYLHLQVPEYWILDYAGQIPEKYCERGRGVKTIVHTLRTVGRYGYDKQEFIGNEVIPCQTFEDLQLTTQQILQLGKTSL
ncbi:Uma2 family endonuclease [Leptolyngbya ohadii]|uniref:Uma2 family endonuclease n=1 Tax=Leptolyngbya ohadii TaxID=1962290 RepID=UPI000B5A0770|nr:Uma2 family endonuclease [Leptolyngbya ohadii]